MCVEIKGIQCKEEQVSGGKMEGPCSCRDWSLTQEKPNPHCCLSNGTVLHTPHLFGVTFAMVSLSAAGVAGEGEELLLPESSSRSASAELLAVLLLPSDENCMGTTCLTLSCASSSS